MLGRKDFTREEIDTAKASIGQQVAAYHRLAKAVDGSGDPAAAASLDEFEPLFFNGLVLALDRPFVHRVRMVTGKDGTPLNEVEMLVDALTLNGGVLRRSTVIKLDPATSVLGLEFGTKVALRAAQFEALADAFFAELEEKYAPR
jgi:hypothetical protein